jgi:5-methylcytosine-specific restriction endonuclease McrA
MLKERRGVCERCGFDVYEILQVHHKDRNKKNIRSENLELLCPNCHAKEHFLEKSWLKGYLD